MQTRFLHQLGVDEMSAFMSFNLAPLRVRRDIAMLRVIHRAALRLGPLQLWKFFCVDPSASRRGGRSVRHSRQLVECPCGRDLDLEIMRRSAFGMIRVYNLLPKCTIAKSDLKSFQRGLTDLVRDRAVASDCQWKVLLSCRHPILLCVLCVCVCVFLLFF